MYSHISIFRLFIFRQTWHIGKKSENNRRIKMSQILQYFWRLLDFASLIIQRPNGSYPGGANTAQWLTWFTG